MVNTRDPMLECFQSRSIPPVNVENLRLPCGATCRQSAPGRSLEHHSTQPYLHGSRLMSRDDNCRHDIECTRRPQPGHWIGCYRRPRRRSPRAARGYEPTQPAGGDTFTQSVWLLARAGQAGHRFGWSRPPRSRPPATRRPGRRAVRRPASGRIGWAEARTGLVRLSDWQICKGLQREIEYNWARPSAKLKSSGYQLPCLSSDFVEGS